MEPIVQRFAALGTHCAVGVADPGAGPAALRAVAAEIDACDRSSSRFRADSDLSRLNAGAGATFPSPTGCSTISTPPFGPPS